MLFARKESIKKAFSVSAIMTIISSSLFVPAKVDAAAVTYTGVTAAPEHKLALWYDRPAADWESEALPIGNGNIGGMVFGGVDQERIQYNEKTLWTGGPGTSNYNFGNRDGAASHLSSVRAKLDAGDTFGAANEAGSYLTGINQGFGNYQNFGNMYLDFKLPDTITVAQYRRELDLEDGIARVSYTYDGVDYLREYFVSYPDNVMVMRLTASQPGKLSLDVRPDSAQSGASITASGDSIVTKGSLTNSMKYESRIKVIPEGGSLTPGTGKLTVNAANSLTVLMSAGTDYVNQYPTYKGSDPAQKVLNTINAASSKTFQALKTTHLNDYRSYFNRVSLNLNDTKPQIPTNQLLSSYSSAPDKALEVLMFQYGRYLLISSSRPGALPANLQGVWNNSNTPPWTSDYHLNVNLQMNYWPAQVANLSEMELPLIDYVESLVAPGRVTAEKHFGVTGGGWAVNTMNNPFGFTAPGWDFNWGWAPSANAFILNNLWETYAFSGDVSLLNNRIYPLLKEASQFWIKLLTTDRDGTLISSPCYSPEQGFISKGCAFDQQLVWDLFTNTIEASQALNTDADFRAQLQAKRDQLSPIKVGKYGQIQEWKDDIDDPSNTHRHVSQLVGLYPGRQINKFTPEWFTAAKTTLLHRGDDGTGWSKANKINLWARLLDGDHARTILSGQIAGSTLKNLFDTHPPFQIDGNFGLTSGMSEMLIQSHLGTIDILPALPSAWSKGSYTGLRARGGFTVDVAWDQLRAQTITLKSTAGNRAKLNYPNINGAAITDETGSAVTYTVVNDDRIEFNTQTGKTYTITGIPSATGGAFGGNTYNLKVKHSGLSMDVNGGSQSEGASIIQWSTSEGLNQQWTFVKLDGLYYKIVAGHSGKVLAVQDASTANNANIIQQTYTAGDTPNDEWKLDDMGGGYYRIVNRYSGKAIDMPGANMNPSTAFIQYTPSTADNQKFQLIQLNVPEGVYNLTVKHSGLNADVSGGSNSEGATVLQWTAGTGSNQKFQITSVGSGYYKIIAFHSGLAVAVDGASIASGAGIVQKNYTSGNTADDEWSIKKQSDGYWVITNRNSGLSIEIANSNTTAGIQFTQNTTTNTDNQKFTLTKIY
jgi:hypothetical protein